MSTVEVQELPIEVRKGVKACSKKPSYPLSHFVSYDELSSNHKAFLVIYLLSLLQKLWTRH